MLIDLTDEEIRTVGEKRFRPKGALSRAMTVAVLLFILALLSSLAAGIADSLGHPVTRGIIVLLAAALLTPFVIVGGIYMHFQTQAGKKFLAEKKGITPLRAAAPVSRD